MRDTPDFIRSPGSTARLPGLRHADHLGVTVPDLDQAVGFFVDVFGAQELYRSRRGPDPQFMPANFDVAEDAALTLAMLRLPPNINLELFEWTGSDRSANQPRPSDVGAHHLCFVVDDIDAACEHLATIDGVRLLGEIKQVGADSPHVSGNRWTYFDTPWGMRLELVDRSRVADPPRFVGPADWTELPAHTNGQDTDRQDTENP